MAAFEWRVAAKKKFRVRIEESPEDHIGVWRYDRSAVPALAGSRISPK